MFSSYDVLRYKQIDRMLTTGLIHGDWAHLLFNVFSFYSFGRDVEIIYGSHALVLIYLSSILGGSLLSLIIYRKGNYRSLGASGGVCGVIFASIFLLPGGSINMFPIPFEIPTYLYAVVFLVFSFVAQRRQVGNIGHSAHLGGAIVGLLVAAAMYPHLVLAAPWMFAAVLGLSVTILVVLVYDPAHILGFQWNSSNRSPGYERSREYDENRERNGKMAEIDRLLEKVSKGGVEKLSESERKKLSGLSKEIYGDKPRQPSR